MKFLEVATRLNQLNNVNLDAYGVNTDPIRTRFYGGVYVENLQKILSEYAPYGRVAFVDREKNYLKFAKPLSEVVKGAGGRFIGMEVNPDKELSVDKIGALFNLPEDTRLVIITDRELHSYASYFCAVREIPLVVIPQETDISYIPTSVLYLKNGEKLDRVQIDVERIVLIDSNLIDCERIAGTYSFVISKLSSLVDYRLYSAISGVKPNKYSYDTAKRAIILAYNIMNTPSFKRANKLLEASYYLGYANALTKGALYDFSSETVTAKLYGKVGGYISLLISLKVLGVYDLAFYGGKKLLQVPDYNARAEEFSSLYNLPNSQVVDGLLAQLKVLKKGKSKKTLAIRALKSEIKSNLKLQSVILDTFSVLGGKTEPVDKCKLATALKHGGDAPFFLNGLSVAREQGVLELIK